MVARCLVLDPLTLVGTSGKANGKLMRGEGGVWLAGAIENAESELSTLSEDIQVVLANVTVEIDELDIWWN